MIARNERHGNRERVLVREIPDCVGLCVCLFDLYVREGRESELCDSKENREEPVRGIN